MLDDDSIQLIRNSIVAIIPACHAGDPSSILGCGGFCQDEPGKIFFLLGLLIMLFSAMLTFILHTHTQVYAKYIIIDGFWTARRVKINLDTITHIRKSRYKKHIFRRAVYNLHSRGIIRFFTSGNEFVELKDSSGFTYRIGTQKAPELFQILKKQLRDIHIAKLT